MKLIALSTDQAPHIYVPLRFFAVAPFFLILAALMLAMDEGNPFTHTHTPALIAAIHCITLGFISMIMLGAMQQVLPVVIGSSLPAPRLMAWLSQSSLTAGTLLLAFGFLLGKPALLNIAWPTLGLAFAIFISAALYSLACTAAQNASKTAILLAVLALLAAVILGMMLTHGYASGVTLNPPKLALAHVSLALGGWVMLLIVGVSYQVVPMFQLTPSYPKWLTLSLAPTLFGILLFNLALLMFDTAPRWAELVAENLFWTFALFFAAATLMLQKQRRRRIPDATLIFYRLAMVALLCVPMLAMTTQIVDNLELLKILAGLVFLVGFAMSLIFGMLYKIVPFLIWFHLFRSGSIHSIPNMKEIIPESLMWRHLWLHGCTLFAALLSPWWSIAAWLFILCLMLQGLLLSYALFGAIAVYRRTLRKLEQNIS